MTGPNSIEPPPAHDRVPGTPSFNSALAGRPRPQTGVGYETRTPEDAERAAKVRAQAKSANDIMAELD